MKQQVSRLSPHQNGKVVAVMMAASCCVFLVPVGVLMAMAPPAADRAPAWMLLLAPLFYLVFGYISCAIFCALYNLLFRHIGGFEYETAPAGDNGRP